MIPDTHIERVLRRKLVVQLSNGTLAVTSWDTLHLFEKINNEWARIATFPANKEDNFLGKDLAIGEDYIIAGVKIFEQRYNSNEPSIGGFYVYRKISALADFGFARFFLTTEIMLVFILR